MATNDDDYLLDYCAECVRRYARGRLATITSPLAIHEEGRSGVRAHYRCEHGHVWTCWWSAAYWFGTDDAAS